VTARECLTRPLLLVVEDDAWLQRITRELLDDEGFEVVSATSGEAGLKIAERRQPSVILLDIGLPHMDGTQFMRHIRSLDVARDIPIIVISARPEALSTDASTLARLVLRKPVDLDELLRGIATVLSDSSDTQTDSPRSLDWNVARSES